MLAAIETLRSRVNSATVVEGSIPERSILCVIPDLDKSFKTLLIEGKLSAVEEVNGDSKADATLTARSDDLISLLEGRLNVPAAFLMGRIKIDASAGDMLLIRKLF